MQLYQISNLRPSISPFLTKRLGRELLIFHRDLATWVELAHSFVDRFANFDSLRNQIESLIHDSQTAAQGLQLTPTTALCVAADSSRNLTILTVQACDVQSGCRLLDCALEAWQLQSQVESKHRELTVSANKFARSVEEQNWLRSFARSIGASHRADGAEQIAKGIFEPLRNLVKASDLFLLVEAHETERTGLVSRQFGRSPLSIDQVRKHINEVPADPAGARKISLLPESNLELLLVDIHLDNDVLGKLVAARWRAQSAPDAFGVYETALLEEAAMLFATQARNIHLVLESNQLVLGTLHAMSSSIDARDAYTQGHSQRVARLAYELARILGLDDNSCQEIYLSGVLHDLGKIGVPDHILHKASPLTDEEFGIIKMHPEIGYRIIERMGRLQFVLPGVLHHHERWDGKGYPHGLKRESIPLMARILAVADSFDAMASSRPYRDAMPLARAASIIAKGAGEQWDGVIVECFQQWLKERTLTQTAAPLIAESLIPQGAPFEISQAVIGFNG